MNSSEFDPIPEDEWCYTELSEARRALLSQFVTFEDIAMRIARSAIVRSCVVDPYRTGNTPQEKSARQAVFRIALKPAELCDLFFNGRDGLRARYWHSPEAGDAATRYLIEALTPALIKHINFRSPCPHPPGVAPMNEHDLQISLRMSSAKVWPMEAKSSTNGRLQVRRWQADPHPRHGHSWRWTPRRNDLEVKTALIEPNHNEHIPPSKRDRAIQIHRHGFT